MASRMSMKAIDARLKGKTVARADDSYRSFESRFDDDLADEERQELSTLSFAVLTICLCALAAGAVFVWRGGFLTPLITPAPVFVSRVEACGQGWTDGMPNGKQLECYLTQNIERLCNPKEREHLAAVFDRYAGDVRAFRAATMAASLAALPAIRQMSVDVTAANAKGVEAVQPAADNSLKQLKDTAAYRMMVEGSKRELDKSRMEAAIQRLFALGYMTIDDFGWRAKSSFEKQFEKAIAGVGAVKQSCRPLA